MRSVESLSMLVDIAVLLPSCMRVVADSNIAVNYLKINGPVIARYKTACTMSVCQQGMNHAMLPRAHFSSPRVLCYTLRAGD